MECHPEEDDYREYEHEGCDAALGLLRSEFRFCLLSCSGLLDIDIGILEP